MNRVLRIADRPAVPWKNGGGTTREIAVFPPDAGMDDFVWRLSMARVEQTGAFSAFDGVDRVLAVLEGRLRLSGAGLDVTLDGGSAPFPFDGGAPIAGEPIAGPVVDLNAMARRGRCDVEMRRLSAGAEVTGGDAIFLLALEPQRIGEDELDRLDVVDIAVPVTTGGAALLVRFTLAGSTRR
ncbi:HutD/Ves family protein [Rhizorhabdus histidinilytica]|uniref:HutD/Ves family protein n=1 Tax=Rhizorhabdus histidinilytica TaxID=439228 RepID=UPI0032202C11